MAQHLAEAGIVHELSTLAGLFLTALLAATVLPAQSEFLLAGLYLTGTYDPYLLVAVATAGNVLGSVINWLLGRYVMHFRDRRWFPVKPAALERAQGWYRRYGRWSLLLSWLPVVGDPLTLAAGIMREPLRVFLPLVAIAKTGRYVALVLATLHYAA